MNAHKSSIQYTVAPCPLGYILVATTEHGICSVALGDDPATLVEDLNTRFSVATITHDRRMSETWLHPLLDYLHGKRIHLDLPIDVPATPFRHKVWSALRIIPYGTTQTYRHVAEQLGHPHATRAVAHACAGNPVALIIPCHRVVRTDGTLGGYRWGIERKRTLIALEAAHVQLCAS